jgi:CMP-N-acetylneuraminate monooxygenase
MEKINIKFLNHSSFYLESEEYIVLVDPWYSGKIFNNSWSLLKDTEDSIIDYSKVKYISISHEHPDHLHWPTLKKIKEKTKEVTILLPKRNNPNVLEECIKLGYKFKYLDYFVENKIEENLSIYPYPHGHDSALIYEIEDKIILNQNDAYLEDNVISTINEKFKKIDLWLFQFSLAGYYGNRTDPNTIIENGTKFHIDKFIKYQNDFKPIMSVPFASYVYFCKEYNNYINDYAVKLEDILEKTNYITQIPFYNENIDFHSNTMNKNNLEKWNEIYENCKKEIKKAEPFPGEEIIIEGFKKIYDEGYRILQVGGLILEFFDYDKNLVIDTSNNKYYFIKKEETPKDWIAGILPSEELLAYIKTPWGADTLNITGTFNKINNDLWYIFMMSKELLYQR